MNSRVVGLFVMLAIVSVLAKQADAHGSGPPYVKINGQYMQTNAIISYTTVSKFSVGSDLASASGYLVNTPMTFEVDQQFFPNPYRYTAGVNGMPITNVNPSVPVFLWNFADGTAAVEGESITHTYTKPGTYIINMEVKYPGKVDQFATINTVQVTILPSLDYLLPKAVILVNGKTIENPARDIVDVNPGQKIQLSAAKSTGKIVSYQWDLGDESGATGPSVSHAYKHDEYFPVYPVLRVTDDKGISNDTFVFLDAPLEKPNPFIWLWYQITEFFSSLTSR